MLEGSLNLKGRELEAVFSFKTPKGDVENDFSCKSTSIKNKDNFDNLSISTSNFSERNLQSPLPQTPYSTPRDDAATKLQKVYKSFRTRRQLADCAVLAEQRWLVFITFVLSSQIKHQCVCVCLYIHTSVSIYTHYLNNAPVASLFFWI